MGLFKKKREPEQHWLEELELFANYFGDLKLDLESVVNEVIEGNYDPATELWDEKWGDYEKGCAFFYVLGVIEGVYGQIAEIADEPDEY